MLTNGLGLYDTSYFGSRAPLVDEIFSSILAHYGNRYGTESENYRLCLRNRTFEPHVAELVLTQMVEREDNITVMKGLRVDSVERAGRIVLSVGLKPFAGGSSERLAGRIFMDASYEGDLAAAAGAPYRVGRESRSEFGEPHAGRIFTRYEERHVETQKYPFEAANGYINLRPFDLCTGRIFPGSTGEGDRSIMAYNYRIFLSRDPANQRPIERPANYSRENYLGLLLDEEESLGTPYPVKSKWLVDDIRKFEFRNHREIPNRKVSWNHGNFTGRNHAFPEADWPERLKILAAHRDHELGLLWFLQNDPEVPAEVQTRARAIGLARDEFEDNGNFPWEIYVREARRIVGRAIFTEHDGSIAPGIDRAPPHADSIAITEWMMDSHECTTERSPGSAYEGAVLLSELTRPGHVAYRCLLPVGIDNLLAPVCLSATHVGWGTIRVEPTWIHIAESAAYACLLSLETGCAPADVAVAALQRRLVENGIMISYFNDSDMAASDDYVPAVQFFGARGFFPSYDAAPVADLDRGTGRAWIEGFCALATGRLDELKLAQETARTASAGNPSITIRDFCRLLAQQLTFALDGSPPHPALRSLSHVIDSVPTDAPRPAKRGEACVIMYAAAKILFSMEEPVPPLSSANGMRSDAQERPKSVAVGDP
jgi:hypothetical protein